MRPGILLSLVGSVMVTALAIAYAQMVAPGPWQSRAIPEAQGEVKEVDGKKMQVRYKEFSGVPQDWSQWRTYAYSDSRPEPPVQKAAMPKLKEFEKNLPPGYKIRMGGDYYQQHKGFGDLGFVMAASIFLIFLALVFQFNSSIKPLLVFAAAPYGVVGAIAALWIMGTPFGFMAFLGVASLIGVIVSHVIVLFDFIEEKREEGEPFEEAVIDAGIIRLRPVMITVGATILALFPLALHGGPLWQPLCYTQIGGLAVATFITLLLVPVLYAIFVLDLKFLQWETKKGAPVMAEAAAAA